MKKLENEKVFFSGNSIQDCISDKFNQRSVEAYTYEKTNLLFSAHISYGKGKYLNQTKLRNLPSTKFTFTFKVVTHRFQLT